MQCQHCGHNNKSNIKFCTSCGKELSLICGKCSFSNQPGDKFCGGCGEKLTLPDSQDINQKTEPKAEELSGTVPEELRQVTIIFVDLVDYTRLSSEKDAEDIHKILSSFFEIVDGIVHSYGGRIDKHIGDAVMGVFGAPHAHGNDPERAVRAAVEIKNSMDNISSDIGIDLQVHIGIASGQVIASGLGSKAHQEYTVTGNSVNLAARLVGMADSDETLISNSVYLATHKIIESEFVGDVTVKGLDSPVKVWRLIKITDIQPELERRPIVGRESELRQFQLILEICSETDSGHILYIRGEAGIGKTRLVEEFTMLTESQGFESHKGLVLDFGVGQQDAIGTIVRSLLELTPASDQDERAQTVKSVLSNELLEADQAVFLNDLLDVPQDPDQLAIYDAMDNETRKKGKQKAVSMLIRNMSSTRPLMIVIEDLHWADPDTISYMSPLFHVASDSQLILVLTSRIEGDPLEQIRRETTGSMKLTTIDLGPLRKEDSLVFADEFFDTTNRFAQDCINRAEGNPLFLEQLLLSTKEKETKEVPGSVQSIVLARIDHLLTYDKQALQASSILGQRFSLEVLRFLIDTADYDPEELIKHYLIRQLEDNYIFAHALVWESVYSSLLRGKRTELHEKAAEWFSTRDPLLYAENLERADNPGAPGAYLDAARYQIKSFHFEPAIQTINRGLSIASDNEDKYNLLMLKGECLREIGQPANSIEVYREALEASTIETEKCRAWIGLAAGMRLTDNFDEALSLLDDAEAVARSSGLTYELSRIHYYRGNLYFPLGNIEGCLEQHGLALESAQEAKSPECEARAMSGLGDAYYSQGKMITSLKHFERCIDLCRSHGFGRIEVENLVMLAWNSLYLNEVQKSKEFGLKAIQASVQAGQQRPEITSRLTTARALYTMGDFDEAEKHISRGLNLVESLGATRFKPFFNIFLTKIRFRRDGFQPETADLIRSSLEICKNTGIGFIGPWVLSTIALVTDDKSSLSSLDEGEKILINGCVGHNYFDFYRDAMEVAWRNKNWDSIIKYADSLEEFIKPEPLPWAEHYIMWGRALAAHGKTPSSKTAEQLRLVKEKAENLNLYAGLSAVEEALAINNP